MARIQPSILLHEYDKNNSTNQSVCFALKCCMIYNSECRWPAGSPWRRMLVTARDCGWSGMNPNIKNNTVTHYYSPTNRTSHLDTAHL